MYPDEGRAPGSATLFIALHDRMLALGVFALCSVVRTRASEVRLAAVIAQQEAVDSYGQQVEDFTAASLAWCVKYSFAPRSTEPDLADLWQFSLAWLHDLQECGQNLLIQVQPPGMNIIYLPFADDIRAPEKDGSFMGTDSHQPAGEEQIDAAEKLLNKLHLQDFQPGMVPNPHLQRHYQASHAIVPLPLSPSFSPLIIGIIPPPPPPPRSPQAPLGTVKLIVMSIPPCHFTCLNDADGVFLLSGCHDLQMYSVRKGILICNVDGI